MFCLQVKYVHYVCTWSLVTRRCQTPWDRESQTVVIHHMGAGDKPRSSARTVSLTTELFLQSRIIFEVIIGYTASLRPVYVMSEPV